MHFIRKITTFSFMEPTFNYLKNSLVVRQNYILLKKIKESLKNTKIKYKKKNYKKKKIKKIKDYQLQIKILKHVKYQQKLAKVYIEVSRHNLKSFIYSSDSNQCLAWYSGGSLGHKGKRKASPYVGKAVLDATIKKLRFLKIKRINVFFKGFGPSRRPVIQRIKKKGLKIKFIYDITPIPFNGTRKKKKKKIKFKTFRSGGRVV